MLRGLRGTSKSHPLSHILTWALNQMSHKQRYIVGQRGPEGHWHRENWNWRDTTVSATRPSKRWIPEWGISLTPMAELDQMACSVRFTTWESRPKRVSVISAQLLLLPNSRSKPLAPGRVTRMGAGGMEGAQGCHTRRTASTGMDASWGNKPPHPLRPPPTHTFWKTKGSL